MARIVSSVTALAALLAFTPPAPAHDGPTAFGEPAAVASAERTVAVTMSDDMRFTPASVAVRQGETIRFAVTNAGTTRHEMMIGNVEELQAHAQLMRAFPEMIHEDDNAVTLEPGETGAFAWKFTVAGSFEFACLVPGHYEAGMRGGIIVGGAAAAPARPTGIPATTSAAAGGSLGHASGDVRRIDKSSGRIAVRHGPISGLTDEDGNPMPAMTMLFAVKDRSWLDRLKVGDPIRFTVVRDAGQLRIDSIEPGR